MSNSIYIQLKHFLPSRIVLFNFSRCGKCQIGQSSHGNAFKSYRHIKQCTKESIKRPTLHGSHVKTPKTSCSYLLLPFLKTRRICISVSFLSGLSLIKSKNAVRSENILRNIPEEVFTESKKKKRNMFLKLFFLTWYGLRYLWRWFRICVTFGPILSLYPLTFLHERILESWWKMLRFACNRTGPTFIKLGQWASSRRDLFSSKFCDIFEQLHEHENNHSWYTTKHVLKKAFGDHWKEIFVKIEKQPVASGCVAQVHRAWMKANMVPDHSIIEEMLSNIDDDPFSDLSDGFEILPFGSCMDSDDIGTDDLLGKPEQDETLFKVFKDSKKDSDEDTNKKERPKYYDDRLEKPVLSVAIKVIHPGIRSCIQQDLAILSHLAFVLESFIPSLRWLKLRESVQEFRQIINKQTDLRYEANGLEKFVENFYDNPNVRFPRPVWPYCKRNVLISTYEDGEPIGDFVKTVSNIPEGLKSQLAMFAIDALLQMVFVDNFVHGDLHAGNVLVQNSDCYVPEDDQNKLLLVDVGDTVYVNVTSPESPVRLVLLDTGLVTSLNPDTLEMMKDVFRNIILGEGEKVAEIFLMNSDHNCKDEAAFIKHLGAIVQDSKKDNLPLAQIQVHQMLNDMFSALKAHQVRLESKFASIILAIYILEELGHSLDLNLDILEKAKPFLCSAAS